MTTLEAVLGAAVAVLAGGGAVATLVAWRGRRQLREIARAEKADVLAADAAERAEVREDTASREMLSVLRDRLRIVEEREDTCVKRLDEVRLSEQAARHKMRDAMQAQINGLQQDKAECDARLAAMDARLSMVEQERSRR